MVRYMVHYMVHYIVHCMVRYMVRYMVHYMVHYIVHYGPPGRRCTLAPRMAARQPLRCPCRTAAAWRASLRGVCLRHRRAGAPPPPHPSGAPLYLSVPCVLFALRSALHGALHSAFYTVHHVVHCRLLPCATHVASVCTARCNATHHARHCPVRCAAFGTVRAPRDAPFTYRRWARPARWRTASCSTAC